MSDDTNDKPEPTNKIEVEISEYNLLKAEAEKAKKLETQFSDLTTKLQTTQSEYEALKSQKTKTPSVSKDELEAEIRKSLASEIDGYKTEVDNYKSALKSRVVTDKVMTELRARNLMPEVEEYIKRDIESMCDIEGDDYKNGGIVVKDADGNIRWSSKNAGQKMDAKELADELVATKPAFFGSNVKSSPGDFGGDGSRSARAGDGSITVAQFERMTAKEQAGLPKDVINDLLNQMQRNMY